VLLPTKDEVLDDITLYWLTNSGASAARLYWENAGRDGVLHRPGHRLRREQDGRQEEENA
jgi:hypothetical protein